MTARGGRTVLTVLGLEARRIGGVEAFAREFSAQLGERGIRSVLCFLGEPSATVREYLSLPNVELRVFTNAMKPLGAGDDLRRLLAEFRPEVLLLEFTPFLSSIPWVAKLNRVPRVYFVDQGSQPEGWVGTPAQWWKRVIARFITWPLTRVLCISEFNLRSIRTRGLVDPGKTVRLYNAADTSRPHNQSLGAQFRARHRIPADAIVVAQASWLIPEKGIPDLVEAVRIARATEPRLHLVLAGDGPQRAEYERLVASNGLSEHVTWTGLVEDPFGEGLFDAADIVTQMSRWEEAFGYVIAEAMATERPVIGTRVGAIPELVVNEETGFVVDRGDSAAAARAIVRLAGDAGLRERMGRAGRARAQELFDLRKNVKQAVSLLGLS